MNMSVSFRIIPSHGLVYVRYDGWANLADTSRVFGDYVAHPDFRPGQKQLIDLSRLTGWDNDYLELMRIQAKKAEVLAGRENATLMVYYAPTPLSFELSKFALSSWLGLDGVIVLVQQSELGSLALLGLAERSFAQLLENAG